ncbi:MAG: transposase [Prevotella sp.]|nr:transposase [Prevotella sp.]
MAQSLCKIYLHIVFHIKTTSPQIEDEHLERLHSYIGQLVNATGCQVVRVGGIGDHTRVVSAIEE